MEKSCKTCKHGIPDTSAFNGIRCDGKCATICYWDYMFYGLDLFNKWEPKEAEKVEDKTYTTVDMVRRLEENWERKAESGACKAWVTEAGYLHWNGI